MSASGPNPDAEVQGLQQGLKRPKRSNTEQKRGTATRRKHITSMNCARGFTYEPGGRGFKSCRARQINNGLANLLLARFHFGLTQG
jgi:hypothetical protein